MPDRYYRDAPEYHAATRARRLKLAGAVVAAFVLGGALCGLGFCAALRLGWFTLGAPP
jgi:hypothetical protein